MDVKKEWPDCVFSCILQAINPQCAVHIEIFKTNPEARCMFCSGQGCGRCQ